jgi:tRNA (guanine6-N2)-methyltransferase
MKDSDIKIKLSYITGIRPVVLNELNKNDLSIIDEGEDSFFIDYTEINIQLSKKLRSVARVYLIIKEDNYNPNYISKHKSLLSKLIGIVINKDDFKTFKISCSGSDSPEVKSISKYIHDTYKIEENEEADLKIHIIKIENTWEVGVQITPRPLSVREYRVANMSGAMDPTIAHAVNSFCNLESAHSYLNIFSGSATLLIEASLSNPNIDKLIGFDNDKKHLSLSIKNIKKAGLINVVKVKEADIFSQPDFGQFDVITSDLPFGMVISKDEDLEKLYEVFVGYCEKKLNNRGRLVIYTSEYEIIESILQRSKFRIVRSLQLKFITNVGAYLRPKIIVCDFKAS